MDAPARVREADRAEADPLARPEPDTLHIPACGSLGPVRVTVCGRLVPEARVRSSAGHMTDEEAHRACDACCFHGLPASVTLACEAKVPLADYPDYEPEKGYIDFLMKDYTRQRNGFPSVVELLAHLGRSYRYDVDGEELRGGTCVAIRAMDAALEILGLRTDLGQLAILGLAESDRSWAPGSGSRPGGGREVLDPHSETDPSPAGGRSRPPAPHPSPQEGAHHSTSPRFPRNHGRPTPDAQETAQKAPVRPLERPGGCARVPGPSPHNPLLRS